MRRSGHPPHPRGHLLPRLRRTGTEPVTAYSDLRLRLILSCVFAPLFVAGTVLLAVWWAAAEPGDAVGRAPLGVATLICGAPAVVALVDLVVVRRRMRYGGPGGQGRDAGDR